MYPSGLGRKKDPSPAGLDKVSGSGHPSVRVLKERDQARTNSR